MKNPELNYDNNKDISKSTSSPTVIFVLSHIPLSFSLI